VEHPTTEMVTGIDIVKEQLRIASGRKLRYSQSDVALRGWAIECRILAESPLEDGKPSTGRITYVREPSGPGVRLESSVYEGLEVTPFYDSLLAKVITWGETRAEAILRMRRALEEYRIMGIRTNIATHQQIINNMRFQGGQIDTAYLEETVLPERAAPPADLQAAAVLAAFLHKRASARPVVSPAVSGNGGSNWKRFRRGLALRQ
jgi:acetyl-CoA carboxylase biotin carboxylase subunit